MPRELRPIFTPIGLLALSMLGACASPMHLSYDFGRAYSSSFAIQADLTRASVTSSQYPLNGVEAAEIRIRARESSTDTESEEATVGVDSD